MNFSTFNSFFFNNQCLLRVVKGWTGKLSGDSFFLKSIVSIKIFLSDTKHKGISKSKKSLSPLSRNISFTYTYNEIRN